MIYKYLYGNPIQTNAITANIEITQKKLMYLTQSTGDLIEFTYTMEDHDIVYGLGENVRGINKRGGLYISQCTDDALHVEDKKSLYGAHNFLIVHGKKSFGIFVDDPGVVRFDIGNTLREQLSIISEGGNLALYLIEASSVAEIVREFRNIIGQSYIPPKWAFGYGQSRWGYKSKEDIREVVKNYRENNIPLDMLYLDIDYMDHYKDFTLSEEAFSDFKDFTKEMKGLGIRLIPIIDAGVKVEEGYPVYEEGIKEHYFCKNEAGEDFTAAVWPGKVHFPDVLNSDARKWFGHHYKFLLDQGIEGFWNDMNEPAIFYSEERLKETFREINQLKDQNLDINSFFHFQGIVNGLNNNPKDYKSFYHNMDGQIIRHDHVHNLYGYYMTRAAAEAFEELEQNKRILLFSRSSYIGMHRYGGIWTGDNMSWWSHLLLNIKMMPSLNMCGFLYSGGDIGGFLGDTTEDLLMRWLEFGIFTPLMRNHTALNTRHQEAYQFSKTEAFGNIIGLRYGLLPYLYSEFVKAATKSEMYFRPLAFDYPEDAYAPQVEDQLMVGTGVMIAPVYQQNALGRYVYLPESMKMYRMKSLNQITSEIVEKGHHYIEVALEEVLLFLKPNHMIPLSYGAQYVDAIDENNLFVLANVLDRASYQLYQDDGNSKDYHNPSHYSTITIQSNGMVTIEGNQMIRIGRIL